MFCVAFADERILLIYTKYIAYYIIYVRTYVCMYVHRLYIMDNYFFSVNYQAILMKLFHRIASHPIPQRKREQFHVFIEKNTAASGLWYLPSFMFGSGCSSICVSLRILPKKNPLSVRQLVSPCRIIKL